MSDEACIICGWESQSGTMHDRGDCIKDLHPDAYTCCGKQVCICGAREREVRDALL